MATRSFTVFQDTPSSSNPPKPVRAASGILRRSVSTSKTNLNPVPELAVVIDKENYNPHTGQKASVSGEKKRKTTVLAPKPHVSAASTGKSSKVLPLRAVTEPEAKKRKVTTTLKPKVTIPLKDVTARKPKRSSPVRKVASLPKEKVTVPLKEVQTTVTSRKPQRTSSARTVVSLPKVPEECVSEPAQEISQAAIDSRCYDLTVSPLADVSEAYQASVASDANLLDQGPFRTVKESSAEPELRDYFTLESFTSLPSSRRVLLSEEPESKPAGATALSTPERVKLYASFTFSSPSSASKRYRDTYATTVPGSPTRRSKTKTATTLVKAKATATVASSSQDDASKVLRP